MPKTIVLHDKIETSIRSVRVRNEASVFSIKINKIWLSTWVRRMAFTTILIGYIILTYISYTINIDHFWTLVKVGIILSMLLCFALRKS
jgi:hypothetical protein